jgi:hypothetical protein
MAMMENCAEVAPAKAQEKRLPKPADCLVSCLYCNALSHHVADGVRYAKMLPIGGQTRALIARQTKPEMPPPKA